MQSHINQQNIDIQEQENSQYILQQIFYYNAASSLVFTFLYFYLDPHSTAWVYSFSATCLFLSGHMLTSLTSIKFAAVYFLSTFFTIQLFLSEYVLPEMSLHFLFCLQTPSALLLLFTNISRAMQVMLALCSLIITCFQIINGGFLVQINLDAQEVRILQISELIIFFISSVRLFDFYQRNVLLLENRLSIKAYSDELSGLHNRHAFVNIGNCLVRKSILKGQNVSLLFLDIDYFKDINDQFGHVTGDKAIKWIGNIIKEQIGEGEIAGRFGGEEFLLILPSTNEQQALFRAEKLRNYISKNPLIISEKNNDDDIFSSTTEKMIHLTASIGITTQKHRIISLECLIDRADKALYQAKCYGRNRCAIN